MAYLVRSDYDMLIQSDNLNQVIGTKAAVLAAAEQVGQQEVISYLIQKYDVDKEFTDTKVYVYNVVRNAGDRVYLDAGAYNAASTYALNALTLYNGYVYRCSTAITVAESFNTNHWALLGAQYTLFYVTLPYDEWDYYTDYVKDDIVFYKNKVYTALRETMSEVPSDTSSAWGTGTTYSVAGTVWPTDTSKWTQGDNRTAQIVSSLVDIVLYHVHSRIAPNNIPDLRVKRYDDAKMWLKSCAQGDYITPNIPIKQPKVGNRIRWGSSSIAKQNNNF